MALREIDKSLAKTLRNIRQLGKRKVGRYTRRNVRGGSLKLLVDLYHPLRKDQGLLKFLGILQESLQGLVPEGGECWVEVDTKKIFIRIFYPELVVINQLQDTTTIRDVVLDVSFLYRLDDADTITTDGFEYGMIKYCWGPGEISANYLTSHVSNGDAKFGHSTRVCWGDHKGVEDGSYKENFIFASMVVVRHIRDFSKLVGEEFSNPYISLRTALQGRVMQTISLSSETARLFSYYSERSSWIGSQYIAIHVNDDGTYKITITNLQKFLNHTLTKEMRNRIKQIVYSNGVYGVDDDFQKDVAFEEYSAAIPALQLPVSRRVIKHRQDNSSQGSRVQRLPPWYDLAVHTALEDALRYHIYRTAIFSEQARSMIRLKTTN